VDALHNGRRRERGGMGGVDLIHVVCCVASRHVANKIMPCDGGFTKTMGGTSGFGPGAGPALQLALHLLPIACARILEVVGITHPPLLIY
jgi:hypothetical protein